MGDLGNFFDLNDYTNVRRSWLEAAAKGQKQVRVWVFQGYDILGNQANPNETFRKQKYVAKNANVYLSNVKVYDTVKRGYFTTGDLDVYSEFYIRGYSSAYTLATDVKVDEYAGDLVEWNGKLWEVSDQLEPVTVGILTNQVWYRTVLRRTQRSGTGIEVGAA